MQNVHISEPPTLRASSLSKVIDEALKMPIQELAPIIEKANQLPDLWLALKARFVRDPHILSKSPAACHLARITFERDPVVDLSPHDLSEELLAIVLLDARARTVQLQTLSLSGNQSVGPDLLSRIIATYPELKTIHLLNTPRIPLKVKLELVKGSGITEMLSSDLLAHPFIEPQERDLPLTYITPLVKQVSWISYGNLDPQKGPNDRFADGGVNLE